MKRGNTIVYDSSSRVSRFTTTPYIKVATSGLFSFNKPAIDLLKLAPGRGVTFHQDPNAKKDWGIEVEPKGLVLRKYKGSDSLCMNSSAVKQALFQSLGQTKGFKIQIGSEPHEGIWPLITVALK